MSWAVVHRKSQGIKFNKYEGGEYKKIVRVYLPTAIRGIFYRVEIVKNMVPEKRRDERLL